MDKQHIRIHLKAYDHIDLDVSTVEIVNITSTNTAGVAKSMFNNTVAVTGVSSARQFTVALTDPIIL